MANVEHYNAQYSNFASDLYAQIRRETFEVDIGQNGWLTAGEQDQFIQWLALSDGSRLLDIACGSGGPTLRIAEKTGAIVFGIDIHADGIAGATRQAKQRGLAERATFGQADGAGRLPFESESFDAIICIDAINHLPDRPRVLFEWARLLKPGGRLVFTDPVVVTGALTNEELAIRSSIGFFLFVAPTTDDELLTQSGFQVVEKVDVTEALALRARQWRESRQKHEKELRKIEGNETYEGQQRFFEVSARIAKERRLSRFAYLAHRA